MSKSEQTTTEKSESSAGVRGFVAGLGAGVLIALISVFVFNATIMLVTFVVYPGLMLFGLPNKSSSSFKKFATWFGFSVLFTSWGVFLLLY